MQESSQNNINSTVFKEEGFSSLLHEIVRIKRSKNPIMILSLFLAQYSTPAKCFSPPNKENKFDKSISIFLMGIKQSIFSEAMQYISFLDFQLSLGNQLKNSDYYLLYKIFSIYPDVLKSSIHIVISSQHPIEFFSIFILNPYFNQRVFHYQFKQTFTEDPEVLKRIFNYISEHKCPINQSLLNNLSRVIPMKLLEKSLKDNEIIPILEPYKYNKEPKQVKSLLISESLIFDRDTNISKDTQSVHLTNSQSFIRSNLNNRLKRTRPDGNSFYIDGNPSSKDVFTKSCKVDKNENKSVTIVPKKALNKDIIIFILVFVVLALAVLLFWKSTIQN